MGVKRCEEASRIPSLLLLSSFRLACVIVSFSGLVGLRCLPWPRLVNLAFWLTSARSGSRAWEEFGRRH